jgi:hypothetical protein
VGSVLISFGGVIGRVGPKDLLLMSIFHGLTNFWFKAVFNKFTDDPIEKYVGVAVIDLINACGCVGSVLISFGGNIGWMNMTYSLLIHQ